MAVVLYAARHFRSPHAGFYEGSEIEVFMTLKGDTGALEL